jgi:hypothetical protein
MGNRPSFTLPPFVIPALLRMRCVGAFPQRIGGPAQPQHLKRQQRFAARVLAVVQDATPDIREITKGMTWWTKNFCGSSIR